MLTLHFLLLLPPYPCISLSNTGTLRTEAEMCVFFSGFDLIPPMTFWATFSPTRRGVIGREGAGGWQGHSTEVRVLNKKGSSGHRMSRSLSWRRRNASHTDFFNIWLTVILSKTHACAYANFWAKTVPAHTHTHTRVWSQNECFIHMHTFGDQFFPSWKDHIPCAPSTMTELSLLPNSLYFFF